MYAEHAPPPGLSGRISCLWEQVSETSRTQLVVPDGCVDLIWGPGGPHVAGPDTGPMSAVMRPGDRFVGIRFRPGAVGGFFGVPPAELRDLRVPLGELPDVAALLDRRRGVSRRDALVAAVRERMRVTEGADAAATDAATAIAAALGSGAAVSRVAWELGFSERQLHRRTLAGFGYSPKVLQRVVRFQRALRLARAGQPLAGVAADAGYADQAHLANEVRRLSGTTMSRLL
ncbi:helix-turn-helix domain-containing protein [Nonomuraea sp. NBC_01738]|uniref:DUF6597 domain-containing transcriptional factor n=1 Tax=Nonomuraea sp. NBC_01738 TaxID=2976003 RepID=UPI002E11BB0A|nr:helix-turn-helix domain-containing protein [Nonomuraea sp. NBC_01738]